MRALLLNRNGNRAEEKEAVQYRNYLHKRQFLWMNLPDPPRRVIAYRLMPKGRSHLCNLNMKEPGPEQMPSISIITFIKPSDPTIRMFVEATPASRFPLPIALSLALLSG